MIAAWLPMREWQRLDRLRSLQLLDTAPDDTLDELVREAARLTDCPIAMLTLVDADRQWFKARHGITMHETPRNLAFCAYTILDDDVFEVTDTREDARFRDNPLVTGESDVRYYAGIPLQVDGEAVGSLCVVDHRPRQLTGAERGALRDLTRSVTRWISVNCPASGDRADLPSACGPAEVSTNRSGGLHLTPRRWH